MMKLIRQIIIISFLIGTLVSKAQEKTDQTLLTVGDEKIPSSEFVRIYLKNHQAGTIIDRKSVDEYLNLFINFRLKVLDAKDSKLDTSSSFKNELAGYRQQLARPYLTDKETEEKLINEAYERMKYEVSASHILISIPEQVVPSDTLKYYDKAIAIRNRIVNGEPFEVVARATSDDPSVANNNGYLGYFTVFQMVYPFESAVYNLKTGEISMPIRTRFGYHIIKVLDKRAAKGQVKVAHIMIAVPKDATEEQKSKLKEKIDEIYKQVLNNENFGQLANKYSEDPGSSKNNGELPWFGSGSIIPEFEKVAFGFDHDGQVSEPFQSSFGWHIVKRLARKEIGSFDEMLPDIKKKVFSDMRNTISVERMIAKIKVENKFREDTVNLKQIDLLVDSSIYRSSWRYQGLKENKNLFEIAGQKHDQDEFSGFLVIYQRNGLKGSIHSIVRKAYNDWVNQTIYNYQQSVLEQKFPEFKYLMQEYHDGILLFNISDLKVWSKASNDSLGLENFYQKNKDNYKWGERVHYVTYSCADEKILAKVSKLAANRKEKGMKPDDVVGKFNKEQTKVSVNYLVVNPDDKEILGYESWKGGISPIVSKDGNSTFIEVISVTTGDIKSLVDCKGQTISDYQQLLEEDWLKSLHQKFPIEINQEAIKQVVESLGKQ
ncbi:MAG: peptidylprolyl isomerase [Bacteroidales bacterium]|nr:peptidylprolyl isomerase [Bacteroidales bacterium]